MLDLLRNQACSNFEEAINRNQNTDFAIQSVDNLGPLSCKEETRNATMYPGYSTLLISLSPCFPVWGFNGRGGALPHG